jgi:hypothetical protein
MSKKHIVLFGTGHWKNVDIPPDIRGSLVVLIDKFCPDVALEEWSITQDVGSGASLVCASKNIPWENIGTPPVEKFCTYGHDAAADFPGPANVIRYGPLAAQEMREEFMCENIRTAMGSHQSGLVVVGVAHLHSMLMKLSKHFNVEGYAYRLESF